MARTGCEFATPGHLPEVRFILMRALIQSRLHSGTWAILVLFLILLLQDRLSSSLALGQITPDQVDRFLRDEVQNQLWQIIKFVVFVPAVVAWLLDRRKALHRWVIVSNSLLTFQLLMSLLLLVLTLGETDKAAALIRDTIIVAVTSVLIFSLWYWLIDSPAFYDPGAQTQPRWDLLFPPRTSTIPGYEQWRPHYIDYLFLAIETTTAFSPADTMPLSRRAKVLMGMQIVIAFAMITVLAARALSILR
jgi:hypothetical protein